jgi:glucose/mannose-6-phosphate isomerase
MTKSDNRFAKKRINLDDIQTYQMLDPTSLRQRIKNIPSQCEVAWQQANSFQVPKHWGRTDRLIIAGMGGSAIAGDIIVDLASLQKAVPIMVVRDFHLPCTVNKHCLIIACSYSGNTEETLLLFRDALRSGATVMALTGGGQLKKQAEDQRIPILPIDLSGEPRTAVPYNVMLLLGVLNRLNLVKTEEHDLRAAIEGLKMQVAQLDDSVPTTNNLAKQLALDLQNKLIVIYGSAFLSGVARRWKTQFNENAKTWAFFETLPELLHNSVEAYSSHARVTEHLMTLLLQPNTETERTLGRLRLVADLLRQNGLSHRVLEGINSPAMAQLMSMLLLGDYISYYLALLNQVDPSPTPMIAIAKEKTLPMSCDIESTKSLPPI